MKAFLVFIIFFFCPFLFSDSVLNAYFAGGCFWGVEYYMEQLDGVLHAESGYMGGSLDNPTYRDVINGNTGHYETVKVVYDSDIVSYYMLVQYFFEIHDPTQKDGQGPDIGEQYLSVVFYNNPKEKEAVNEVISILKNKGYDVATKVLEVSEFYKAEDYHQDYYTNNGKLPYCHFYIRKF